MGRILIVDDNDHIIKLLTLFLNDLYEITVAQTGEGALKGWRKSKPDLVILDIMLPDFSGYEVCAMAKSDLTLRDTPVVFLSAKSGHDAREKGYELGAVNYVEKPFKKGELLAIIKSTLAMTKGPYSENEILKVQNLSLNLDTYEANLNKEKIDLTIQEFKILYAFLIKVDRVISREEILTSIGKGNEGISDRTVDSHISHIRKKIKESKIEIKSVYGAGYKASLVKSDS